MRELRTGLWHWQSRHPERTPDEHWGPEVSSYAIDYGERLLLFDPLAVPTELEELLADREPVVVLTAPWHERDTRSLVERFHVPVFAPPPDSQQDLMQKYGVTAEQAAGGSPDLAWLVDGSDAEAHWFAAGDRLPFGIEAFPGREHNDLVLWVESRRAVIAGDTLADFGRGLDMPAEWLRPGVTHEGVADGLRPLLRLPVELVLPAQRAANRSRRSRTRAVPTLIRITAIAGLRERWSAQERLLHSPLAVRWSYRRARRSRDR